MQIKILKSTDNYLELQIDGEDHTLGNLLSGLLRSIDGVVYASYYQPHPLVQSIIVKVMTNGDLKPLDAVKKAIERAEEYTSKFIEEVKSL